MVSVASVPTSENSVAHGRAILNSTGMTEPHLRIESSPLSRAEIHSLKYSVVRVSQFGNDKVFSEDPAAWTNTCSSRKPSLKF